MRIDSLTPEQAAMMATVRDEWIAHGLSIAPADWPAAEAAMIRAYEIAGLAPPARIVRCSSPLALAFTDAILSDLVGASVRDSVRASVGASVRDSVGDSVGASVWDSVRDSVGASVRDSVWDSVRASVGASVRDSVGDSVGDSVRDSVRASVGASVRDSVGDSVGASVRDSVRASVGASVNAQYESHWLAYYDFFGRCGIDTSRLAGLAGLNRSAGWWIARAGIALIADRPRVLHRDAEGRLHCEDGQAIAWPDGWGVYAIHGVRVPGWIVEHPERITVATIDAEPNAEVKRAMLDRYGMARFLADSGAELVGEDRHGRLYRRAMPGGEDIVCLVVDNSTPEPNGSIKQYALGIHPECRPLLGDDEYGDPQPLTPRNAVASTFGLRGEQYRPEIET